MFLKTFVTALLFREAKLVKCPEDISGWATNYLPTNACNDSVAYNLAETQGSFALD